MDDFTDDRPKQDSLIKRPERAEPETRIDRGASDEFADDRLEADDEPEAGDQSELTGDREQRTLGGGHCGPDWRDD